MAFEAFSSYLAVGPPTIIAWRRPLGGPPSTAGRLRCMLADIDPRYTAAQRVLRAAVGRHGGSPLPWLRAPLRGAERVLDWWSHTGPCDEWSVPWVGDGQPDPSSGVLALPARSIDAVCLTLVLPLLVNVDAAFAEIRRVLRPAGTVVALVPSVVIRSPPELRLIRLLRAGRRGGWPNRSGLDHAFWLFAAADFAVLADDRVAFSVPVPDAGAAGQLVDDLHTAGIWSPTADGATRRALTAALAERAGPNLALPVPLRRVVARR